MGRARTASTGFPARVQLALRASVVKQTPTSALHSRAATARSAWIVVNLDGCYYILLDLNGKTSGYGGPLRGNGDASLTGPRVRFPIEI